MQINELTSLIQTAIPEARVIVDGEGCNFAVTVVSKQFTDLPTIQRQRMVLASVQRQLASGELHAITVEAKTPQEHLR